MITTLQAATSLGISAHRVCDFIKNGSLRASRSGGEWLIDEGDFEKFTESRMQFSNRRANPHSQTLISTPQASLILGITLSRLRRLIKKGYIPSEKLWNKLWIELADVERFKSSPPPRPVYKKSTPLPKRFWVNVDVRGADECWEWKRARKHGYGVISVMAPTKKQVGAHRIAWELAHGFAPDGVEPKGLLVCHTCDNPPCCNQKHLFAGTELDNSQDRTRKGRGVYLRGESNRHAKLTSEQVQEIRALYRAGMMQRVIASKFGVSNSQIQRICDRTRWKHI